MTTASVVLYNTSAYLFERLMECVRRSPIDMLYIIDHSPEPSEPQCLRPTDRYTYISQPNRGYGAGHNVGMRRALDAGADYHAVLNPDIYWSDPVFETLIDYMDSHPEVGQVMPRILYPDGSVQHLCKLLPTPMDLFGRRFLPLKGTTRRRDDFYEMHWTGYDSLMEVPSLSGCFMFMRCDTLRKTGIFDERYFMYAEDLDLCRRIGSVSATMFNPAVDVYHEYMKGSYASGKLLRHHVRSVIKYFNKWGWFADSHRRKRNSQCINRIRKLKEK